MERCDFSSVMAIVRRYISEDHGLNQMDLLYELFASFLNDDETQDFDLDNGLVCKWLSGQARLSPRISAYYQEPRHKEQLVQDIAGHILPLMYDIGMAAQELSELVSLDSSISEREKKKLLRCYPVKKESDDAQLMADILCFAMERSFVKRDAKVQKLLTTGSLSPVLQDYVLDGSLPKPCRTFCGREQELSELQALLEKQDKVFLYGIAGIGKSELAKAYAWQHRRDYTNILHLLYPGSLKQMIVEMEFTDDQPGEDDAERFRRHNRFLRSLKEDTLLIIDNFNTTAGADELLPVVLKYRCRILFTTRSRFEQSAAMQLAEISDKQALLRLMAAFYSGAERQPELMKQIIDTVHSIRWRWSLQPVCWKTAFWSRRRCWRGSRRSMLLSARTPSVSRRTGRIRRPPITAISTHCSPCIRFPPRTRKPCAACRSSRFPASGQGCLLIGWVCRIWTRSTNWRRWALCRSAAASSPCTR
jgi:hypothetical protein